LSEGVPFVATSWGKGPTRAYKKKNSVLGPSSFPIVITRERKDFMFIADREGGERKSNYGGKRNDL